MKKLALFACLVILAGIIFLSSCGSGMAPTTTRTQTTSPRPTTTATYTTSATTVRPTTTQTQITITTQPAPTIIIPTQTTAPTIGFSAGGAKDVDNFRVNIANNYLPLPTDITFEGLFYDYYFDTGASEPTDKLYAPSYSYAVTADPFSGETEYYLSVGLNSGMTEEDFARKQLNLVIVIDVSGSMGEQYNEYYYDRWGKQQSAYEGVNRLTKLESAADAVVRILDQLDEGDRVGVVTFNSQARVIQTMQPVGETSMYDLRNKVLDLRPGGSTNMSGGMNEATRMVERYYSKDSYEYENRIIFLTDAQPNTGDTSASGMMDVMKHNAGRHIYTTFIGVGVDFNSSLIEDIIQVKGANYYSVHSPSDFRERIEEEFDFMVTPLVFDLRMDLYSDGWRIEKVFGSPEADQATGNLMKIHTLFPAKADESGNVRGGIVLLKLRKMSSEPDEDVFLRVTYEDRNGHQDEAVEAIPLQTVEPEYFQNSGIRKAILLTRYAALMQNWTSDQYRYARQSSGWKPCMDEGTGIVIQPYSYLSQWERQSMHLMVSGSYEWIFRDFRDYFRSEMDAIGDDDLEQELDILDTLCR